MLAVSLPFCSVSLINECENLIPLILSLIPQEVAHVPCGGCIRKKQQEWNPERTARDSGATGAAPPLRQPGAPGRTHDSFLCAPQQTCAHLQRVQTVWARTPSPGSPRPRPEPLLPSPQHPDCSPWLARGEALRVPAVTPAGTPSWGHTQPLGWSSGCRAPRISPDFKPLLLCL